MVEDQDFPLNPIISSFWPKPMFFHGWKWQREYRKKVFASHLHSIKPIYFDIFKIHLIFWIDLLTVVISYTVCQTIIIVFFFFLSLFFYSKFKSSVILMEKALYLLCMQIGYVCFQLFICCISCLSVLNIWEQKEYLLFAISVNLFSPSLWSLAHCSAAYMNQNDGYAGSHQHSPCAYLPCCMWHLLFKLQLRCKILNWQCNAGLCIFVEPNLTTEKEIYRHSL